MSLRRPQGSSPVRLDRQRFLLAILLLWFLPGSTRAQEASVAGAKQAAERLAAVTAARQVIADLGNVRPEGLPGQWSREILQDPRSHQRVRDSRTLLERQYLEEMKGVLRKRLARLQSSLNPSGVPASFTADWLIGYVEKRLDGEVETALHANADRQFGPLFNRARQDAVAAQLAGLELEARPRLDEIDAVAVSGWKAAAEERLRENLVSRMSHSATLLEENGARLEERASALLEDARHQYEAQAAALELLVDPELRVADDLAKALAARVEEARLERRMAGGAHLPLYGVFPSIARRIEPQAAKLEFRRFTEHTQRARLTIDPGEIRSRVEGNLARHRRFDDSLHLLVRELSPAFARQLLDGYAQGIQNGTRKAAFRKRLGRQLEESSELAAAFKARVEAILSSPLAELRREIAEKQMAKLFPEVATGRYVVPESVLLKLHRKELDVATFDECLDLPRLREGGDALDRHLVLDATEEMVLTRTGKLLQEGQRALEGQLQLVSSQEESIDQTLRRREGEHPPSYWEAFFIGKVDAQWREMGHPALWRGASHAPENAATKYLPLFGYVEDQIRKNVRAHIEAMTAQEVRQEPPTKPRTTATNPDVTSHSRDGSDRSGGGDRRKGWFFGGAAEPSCLTWLLLLLDIVLILLLLIRTGAWRTFLSIGAWVLATTLFFAFFWLLGKREVDVADLHQATGELQVILGVRPDSVDSDTAVFKLGPISRLVLRQAERDGGGDDEHGTGGRR